MRVDVSSPDDSRIALYGGVSDPDLLAREGRFVAEGRLVVRRLLATPRLEIESVLVTPAALADMADVLEPAAAHVPVYVAPRDVLVRVAGFNIHRGCLALGRRPAPADAATLLPPDHERALVVVLEALANADNVGGIFRSAQAFGAGAVLLDEATCDPLYRKAIRTSMGASLVVPFARVADWPRGLDLLAVRRFTIVALTPHHDAADIGEAVGLPTPDSRLSAGPAPGFRLGAERASGFGLQTGQATGHGARVSGGSRGHATQDHEPGANEEPGTSNGPRAGNGGLARTGARRIAVLVGHEGSGLSDAVEQMADVRVRIPMAAGVDSLNASTATGIALHAFARYCGLV